MTVKHTTLYNTVLTVTPKWISSIAYLNLEQPDRTITSRGKGADPRAGQRTLCLVRIGSGLELSGVWVKAKYEGRANSFNHSLALTTRP